MCGALGAYVNAMEVIAVPDTRQMNRPGSEISASMWHSCH